MSDPFFPQHHEQRTACSVDALEMNRGIQGALQGGLGFRA